MIFFNILIKIKIFDTGNNAVFDVQNGQCCGASIIVNREIEIASQIRDDTRRVLPVRIQTIQSKALGGRFHCGDPYLTAVCDRRFIPIYSDCLDHRLTRIDALQPAMIENVPLVVDLANAAVNIGRHECVAAVYGFAAAADNDAAILPRSCRAVTVGIRQ